MSTSLPNRPADITNEWLTAALRASGALTSGEVADIELTDIGEGTGIFGEIARLTLTYRGDASGAPSSVVAKMPCTEPENLAVAQALGLYGREINFFRDVAPATQLRVPTCHFAELADDGRFVLILEDMSLSHEVGDQVVGATLEQATTTIDALAGLHATWWESDELATLDWLPVPNAPEYQAAVPDIYRAGLPVLTDEWADRVPAATIELAHRLEPNFEELMHRTAAKPHTFVHADTRLDNLFFARDGSGDVAFIDFQLALRGRGVSDLAYLLGTSAPLEVSGPNWERLLRRWHDRITELGVQGYSWDDALTGYREAALYYLVGAMSLIAAFDTGNDRGAAMAEAYVTRLCHHVVDCDAHLVLD